jgi:hypothetical protein
MAQPCLLTAPQPKSNSSVGHPTDAHTQLDDGSSSATALLFLDKPETFEWHAGATMATWFMTLVIQRAEHRDTQAIHAKLDEMLHVMGEARNELTRVDEEEPEEIEERRQEMRKDD